MRRQTSSFRIGRVQGYLRGTVWYLCYFENGKRRRPRIGSDLDLARRTAAQTNAQLESGDATLLSFEPIAVPALRQRWLDHHEHVLRSSVQTIDRYRTATDHLLSYLTKHPIKQASLLTARHVEVFVQYLRTIEVAPNGHPHTAKRRLLDKGVKYILECCRALFAYAGKHRHLSPYAANPFSTVEIQRMPIENAKPIVLLTPQEEVSFLEACNDWQLPIFATLMLTGIRPGELCHLLVEDADLEANVLRIVNKAPLGWRIKTRSERVIPLVPALADLLRAVTRSRSTGVLFRQPRCSEDHRAPLDGLETDQLTIEAARRAADSEVQDGATHGRKLALRTVQTIWRDLAAISEDRVRLEFIRICRSIRRSDATAPKLLRHGFATALQDANVDPLIRSQLMGHSTAGAGSPGSGLGMTAVYTHSRPQTVRQQMLTAMTARPLYGVVERRTLAWPFAAQGAAMLCK